MGAKDASPVRKGEGDTIKNHFYRENSGSGTLYRKNETALEELLFHSKHNYSQLPSGQQDSAVQRHQLGQSGFSQTAAQAVSVFENQRKLPTTVSEADLKNESDSYRQQRSSIKSLLRQEGLDQSEYVDDYYDLVLAQAQQKHEQQQYSKLLQQPNIQKLTTTKNESQYATTQPRHYQTDSSFHSQTEQLILRASGYTSASSIAPSASGRTPSPLKSMAELIRQTQEQLRHLTPERINAQVTAELLRQSQAQRVIPTSHTSMGSRPKRDHHQLYGLKGIDMARRGTDRPMQHYEQIHKRPNTVLFGGINRIGHHRQNSIKKFVPLNTVQIRAYEFANLKVSGEAPAPVKNPQAQWNKDIAGSPLLPIAQQRIVPQKPPKLQQCNSNYSNTHLETDYLGDVTLKQEETLYLEKNPSIIQGEHRDVQVPRVSKLTSSRKSSAEAHHKHQQYNDKKKQQYWWPKTQASMNAQALGAIPVSGGLIVNRNQQFLSDSKESIEEEMFSMVRLNAKNNTPEQQQTNDENADDQLQGEESDDHTLQMNKSQQDSSYVLMQKSKDAVISPTICKKMSLRQKEGYLKGGMAKLLYTLIGKEQQHSARVNAHVQIRNINGLPYQGEQISPPPLADEQSHTYIQQNMNSDSGIYLRQQIAVKVDDSQHHEIINTQQSDEKEYDQEDCSPSAQSGIHRNSRTVYSKANPRMNDNCSSKVMSPQSRRSVFQRSVSKDMSPSNRLRDWNNNTNTVTTELENTEADQTQPTERNQADEPHVPNKQSDEQQQTKSINLNPYGKLQMLKHALKSQAQLADMIYQMNLRTVKVERASMNAPQIFDEQRDYLETFNARMVPDHSIMTRNIDGELNANNMIESNKSSPIAKQARMQLISTQRNSDVIVTENLEPFRSNQNTNESWRRPQNLQSQRLDTITFQGSSAQQRTAMGPTPKHLHSFQLPSQPIMEEPQMTKLPASRIEQSGNFSESHSNIDAERMKITKPETTTVLGATIGSPENKYIYQPRTHNNTKGLSSIGTRNSADRRHVRVYSVFTSEADHEEPNIVSNSSIIAKKSNNQMHKLMKSGASRGSMYKTIQLTDLLGNVKMARGDKNVNHKTSDRNESLANKSQSIAVIDCNITTRTEPFIDKNLSSNFSRFHQHPQGRLQEPRMMTMSMEAIGKNDMSNSLQTLQQESSQNRLHPAFSIKNRHNLAKVGESRSVAQVQQFREKYVFAHFHTSSNPKVDVRPQPQITLNRYQSKQKLLRGKRRKRSTLTALHQARPRHSDSQELLPRSKFSRDDNNQKQNIIHKQTDKKQQQSSTHKSVKVGSDEVVAQQQPKTFHSVGISAVTSKSPGEPRKRVQHDRTGDFDPITLLSNLDVSSVETILPMLKENGREQDEDAVMTTRNSDIYLAHASAANSSLENLLEMVTEVLPRNRIEQHFAIKRARKAHQQRIQQTQNNSDLYNMLADQYQPIITGQSTFLISNKAQVHKNRPRSKNRRRSLGSTKKSIGSASEEGGGFAIGKKVVVPSHLALNQSLNDSEETGTVAPRPELMEQITGEPESALMPIGCTRKLDVPQSSGSIHLIPTLQKESSSSNFPAPPKMIDLARPSSLDLRPMTDHQKQRRTLNLIYQNRNEEYNNDTRYSRDDMQSETSQLRTGNRQSMIDRTQVVVLQSKLAPDSKHTPN